MQMSDQKAMIPSTTFGVTSTTGTRPIAVVAPMCHHPAAAPIVKSITHRPPCNDPAAGADVAVLPPAQEAGATFIKDLVVPCGGAAASNSIREGPGKSRVTTGIRSVPTLRTAPFSNSLQSSTVVRTSMLGTDSSLLGNPVQGVLLLGNPVQGNSLLGTPVLGTPVVGASVQGISLFGTSSWDFPCSDGSPTWIGSDCGATSGDGCHIDTITIRDRRPASVLGHPCAAAAGKTSGDDLVMSGLTASLQRFLLDSNRTQGQCPDVILRETTPSSVSMTTSSQLADPHLVPSLEEPTDLSGAVDECNFYYGRMSNAEAKSRLHRCAVGTFLLRDSSDARFRYSLSVKTSRGTTSIRIVGGTGTSSSSGQFRLDSDPHQESRMPGFRWILSLVEHYFLSATSSSASKSSSTEKGRHHRQKGQCVLLESSGRYDTPMLLRKPLEVSPAPLAHLCRRTLNNLVPLPSVERRRKLIDALNVIGLDGQRRKSVEEYMMRYPFRV